MRDGSTVSVPSGAASSQEKDGKTVCTVGSFFDGLIDRATWPPSALTALPRRGNARHGVGCIQQTAAGEKDVLLPAASSCLHGAAHYAARYTSNSSTNATTQQRPRPGAGSHPATPRPRPPRAPPPRHRRIRCLQDCRERHDRERHVGNVVQERPQKAVLYRLPDEREREDARAQCHRGHDGEVRHDVRPHRGSPRNRPACPAPGSPPRGRRPCPSRPRTPAHRHGRPPGRAPPPARRAPPSG